MATIKIGVRIYPEGSGIYAIRNTVTGRVYIGSTSNFPVRLTTHKTRLNSNTHPNKFLQQSYSKHGAEAFEFVVLEFVERDADLLMAAEQRYIDQYQASNRDKGYNLSPTANKGCLGIKRSSEQIERHRQTMKGRPVSDEVRARLLSYATGRVATPEQRARQSVARKGIPANPQGIAKMMQSEYHKTAAEKNGREYVITTPEGEVLYIKNLMAFCRERGLIAQRLSEVASGRKYSWKGWRCHRKSEYSEAIANQAHRTIHKSGYWVGLEGEEMQHIDNVTLFCQAHDLRTSAMFDVASGRKRIHKGWLCRRAE